MLEAPTVPELNVAHLQAELARLDARLHREYRRWVLAGENPGDEYRGLHISQQRAEQILGLQPFHSPGHAAALPADEAELYAGVERRSLEAAGNLVKLARAAGAPTRIDQLASGLGLDRIDLDIFLTCLAPHVDLRYERLYGFLQDDVTRRLPTVNLILDLVRGPGPERLDLLPRFHPQSPLMRQHLLEWTVVHNRGDESMLSRVLQPDASVVSWLLGKYEHGAALGPDAQLLGVQVSAEDRLLAGEVWPAVERMLNRVPIVALYGPDAAAHWATARLIAAAVGRPLLAVDVKSAGAQSGTLRDIVGLILRDAVLLDAVPFLMGWDTALEDGAPHPGVLQLLCEFPDVAIVAGRKTWLARGLDRDRPVLWAEFAKPSYQQRKALWGWFTGRSEGSGSSDTPDADLADLAGQFTLTAEQIRDAVATAGDESAIRGEAPGLDDFYAGARLHSNPNLAQLAKKVDPRYSWTDIILPRDQLSILREIVTTVRERPKVLEEWGVGKKLAASDGITVLFGGPPGTGKTMAAQVIAAELKLDLYKIDLSTVVSKYIGETEKNLERIFGEAQDSNAILFFDEADALFGKRSEVRDAHDRYANIEVSYLLQRMEAYDGVTILATNLRANLDEAFVRRLQFIVDFPFPEEDDRLRIWETLFPSDVPRAADLDFGLLARRFRLAGGNIRNIIVSAAFLAAADNVPVAMPHLLHGTRRELQKMGRLVDEADMALG